MSLITSMFVLACIILFVLLAFKSLLLLLCFQDFAMWGSLVCPPPPPSDVYGSHPACNFILHASLFLKTFFGSHFIQDQRIQVTFCLAPISRRMGSSARCYSISNLCYSPLPTLTSSCWLWGSRLLLFNHYSFTFHISPLKKFSRDMHLILYPYLCIIFACDCLQYLLIIFFTTAPSSLFLFLTHLTRVGIQLFFQEVEEFGMFLGPVCLRIFFYSLNTWVTSWLGI